MALFESRLLSKRIAYEWRKHAAAGGHTPPRRRRGRLILHAPEARLRIDVRHAELPRVENERAATWRVIPREGRRPITDWPGYEDLRIRVVLFLDGLLEFPARPVEPQIEQLRTLTLKVDGLDRPPWLRAIGVVDYPGTRWVLTKPFNIVREEYLHGRCVRARAELTLLEFVGSEVDLQVEKARTLVKRRTHRWQRGDTLSKLADRYLGDARRAPDIRAANPRVKAWSRVSVDTEIVIPPA